MMSNDFYFKIEASSQNWGASKKFDPRLPSLFEQLFKKLAQALKTGEVTQAQEAIAELWSVAVHLRGDPYLVKINHALSQQMLYSARQIASEMFADPAHLSYKFRLASSTLPNSLGSPSSPKSLISPVSPMPSEFTDVTHEGPHKKATEGTFGRLVDVSA
jgi:hypothetical protein